VVLKSAWLTAPDLTSVNCSWPPASETLQRIHSTHSTHNHHCQVRSSNSTAPCDLSRIPVAL